MAGCKYDNSAGMYKNKIKFVFQNIPKGTGDAVLKTQKYIKNKYFFLCNFKINSDTVWFLIFFVSDGMGVPDRYSQHSAVQRHD